MDAAVLAQENTLLKARLAQVEAALAESQEANRRLEDILRTSRRAQFGKRSEKLSPDQFHLPLEDAELAQGVLEVAQEKAEEALQRARGNRPGQIEAAEPSIREVEMNLLAKPPFGPDAHDIADQQHPDHQLRVDRRPSRGTVEGREMLTQAGEIDEPVDQAKHVVWRDMSFNRELVKQCALRVLPRSHHRRPPPPTITKVNQRSASQLSRVFQQNTQKAGFKKVRSWKILDGYELLSAVFRIVVGTVDTLLESGRSQVKKTSSQIIPKCL